MSEYTLRVGADKPTPGAIHLGFSGHLDPPKSQSTGHGGYDVTMIGDMLHVSFGDGTKTWDHTIPGFQSWYAERFERKISLGWGVFPDDAEVIFLYDKADDYFGYALNLDCDWCSEWGTSPFWSEGRT